MKKTHFDIAIVGRGIGGLSSAYHLGQRGFTNIALIADKKHTGESFRTPGILTASFQDNFTRFSHAHGLDFAAQLWRFSHAGFDKVLKFCKAHKVPYHKNRRLRFLVTKQEVEEGHIAVQQLQRVGFKVALRPQSSFGGLTDRVLEIQDEGEFGAWIDTEKLLQSLKAESQIHEFDSPLRSLQKGAQGLRLELADGRELTAEAVILACHTHIGDFVPSVKEALVTYADQWSEVELAQDTPLSPGLVFSAHHGYEWGLVCGPRSLRFGGARYLRPLAGIGASEAPVLDKVTAHLQEQLAKTFTWAKDARFRHSTGLVDIWPCDEVPVIGPMFGEDRILLTTGYMGTGLGLGFQAGFCLAELLKTGKSSELPRRLWPERLRSL